MELERAIKSKDAGREGLEQLSTEYYQALRVDEDQRPPINHMRDVAREVAFCQVSLPPVLLY